MIIRKSQTNSDRYLINGSPWSLLFLLNHSNHAKLTSESSLQLDTAKLFAYAELIKSEFNKISEIFPIFINLTSFSRYAVMIQNKIQNSLFKIVGHVSGFDSLLKFIDEIISSNHFNDVKQRLLYRFQNRQ